MSRILFTSDIAVDYPIINTNIELSWLHEENNNRETLLVTIGDSWTWGDHLGSINWIDIYDDPLRLKSIYGKKLSEQLDADWILMAKPGCSNHWMLEKIKLFYYQILELKSKYKRIIVTVTLTEDFREFEYNKELRYTEYYYQILNNSDSLYDFLLQSETLLFEKFKKVFDDLDIEFYITRAFTDIWPENKNILENNLLDKTWCDVIQDEIIFSNYNKVVPYIGGMSINGVTKLIQSIQTDSKQQTWKHQFIEIENLVRDRYNFFDASWYNIKGSSWHPNIEGHKLYADYLGKNINK